MHPDIYGQSIIEERDHPAHPSSSQARRYQPDLGRQPRRGRHRSGPLVYRFRTRGFDLPPSSRARFNSVEDHAIFFWLPCGSICSRSHLFFGSRTSHEHALRFPYQWQDQGPRDEWNGLSEGPVGQRRQDLKGKSRFRDKATHYSRHLSTSFGPPTIESRVPRPPTRSRQRKGRTPRERTRDKQVLRSWPQTLSEPQIGRASCRERVS